MRILLDEVTARRYIFSHKHREGTLCFSGILDRDLTEKSLFRIHSSALQLLCTHLSETFVTLHEHTLFRALSELEGSFLALRLCPAVDLLLALLHKIEWRSGQIYVSVLDQVDHITEEECQDEGGDVASVDIGIGHNDDLMITQLAEVQCLAVFLRSDCHTESRVDVPDFLTLEDPVFHSLLNIEDLTSERKDGLGHPVTSLLCGTACGVSLDEEELAHFRIS